MRLRVSNIVWRSGFTAANTHHTPKPRKISGGAARPVNEIATAQWRARRMLCGETETINAHLAPTGHGPER